VLETVLARSTVQGGLPMSAKKKPVPKKNAPAEREVVIPDRLYFRIGEVAELCALPAYVLRFWETEFPQLKPGKGSTGQRMYRRRDVELALRIRRLLYDEGFTIAGARDKLKAETKAARLTPSLPFPKASGKDGLKQVRQGLKEILGMLSARR
jgi:DNA-binding transcriptional MerR regulator